MVKTHLSTKGQIILPKNLRDAHGWKPGTEFTVVETANGILLSPASRFPHAEIDDVAGCLHSERKPVSLTEMNSAIARQVRRRRDTGRYS